MAVPKQRNTKSKRNSRRSHIRLAAPKLVPCPKCGTLIPPHTVCPNCGYYKGKEIIDVMAKLDKKEKKRREKEIKAKQEEEKEKKPLTMGDLSKKKF